MMSSNLHDLPRHHPKYLHLNFGRYTIRIKISSSQQLLSVSGKHIKNIEISRKISISQHSGGTKETKFSLLGPCDCYKAKWNWKGIFGYTGQILILLPPLYLHIILLSTDGNNRTEIRKVSVAVSNVLRERHCNAESTSIFDWTRMKQSM